MGKDTNRFVGKAEAGQGWRIWDRQQKKWWGNAYRYYPEELLAELNGRKRPEQLMELARAAERNQT